jgi:AraC family transcriptional regulator, dual regulator of chb operon
MDFYTEEATHFIDPNTEIHYAIHTSYKDSRFPHIHDFYELMLILKGTQLLTINGKNIFLKESCLSLIRPTDIHSKKYIEPGMHINLAFPQKTTDELLHYLGEGFPREELLHAKIPPYVILSHTEKNIIQNRLEELNLQEVSKQNFVRTHLRILLFELFIKYFTNQVQQDDNMPPWLTSVNNEMKKKENFSRGLPALLEISQKSHAVLCRSFKKYLHSTPINFINEQRLNYAANLLMHSDLAILDICLDAGFENLSHFYHIFKKTYSTTPAEYRHSRNPTELM